MVPLILPTSLALWFYWQVRCRFPEIVCRWTDWLHLLDTMSSPFPLLSLSPKVVARPQWMRHSLESVSSSLPGWRLPRCKCCEKPKKLYLQKLLALATPVKNSCQYNNSVVSWFYNTWPTNINKSSKAKPGFQTSSKRNQYCDLVNLSSKLKTSK